MGAVPSPRCTSSGSGGSGDCAGSSRTSTGLEQSIVKVRALAFLGPARTAAFTIFAALLLRASEQGSQGVSAGGRRRGRLLSSRGLVTLRCPCQLPDDASAANAAPQGQQLLDKTWKTSQQPMRPLARLAESSSAPNAARLHPCCQTCCADGGSASRPLFVLTSSTGRTKANREGVSEAGEGLARSEEGQLCPLTFEVLSFSAIAAEYSANADIVSGDTLVRSTLVALQLLRNCLHKHSSSCSTAMPSLLGDLRNPAGDCWLHWERRGVTEWATACRYRSLAQRAQSSASPPPPQSAPSAREQLLLMFFQCTAPDTSVDAARCNPSALLPLCSVHVPVLDP